MGGSKKMQQVRSIANRPQGGGNKKQGLPPSIGRAGWFSNFIRTNAGGYFRSIPAAAAPAAVTACVKGAVWDASEGVTDKTWVDITSDATGQYVWAIANDGNVGEANILLRSTDYGVTFKNFIFDNATIDEGDGIAIAIAPDNPDVVYLERNKVGDHSYYFKSVNGTDENPTFSQVTQTNAMFHTFFSFGVGNLGNQLILGGGHTSFPTAASFQQSNNGAPPFGAPSSVVNSKITDISIGGPEIGGAEHQYILVARTTDLDAAAEILVSATGLVAGLTAVSGISGIFVACAVSRTSGTYMYASDNVTGRKIWRSENFGVDWTSDAADQPTLVDSTNEVYSHKGLSCSADGQHVVVSTWTNGGGTGYIYVSADFGNSWTRRQAGQWQSLTSNSDGKKIIAGKNNGGISYSNCD